MSMKYRCQIYWWKFQTALQGNFELYNPWQIFTHGQTKPQKSSIRNLNLTFPQRDFSNVRFITPTSDSLSKIYNKNRQSMLCNKKI